LGGKGCGVVLNQTKKNIKKKSTLREYVEAFIIAIILALFIKTFIIQAFKIPSGSMKPTLQVGDHLLVNKFIYGIKLPFIRKTLIPISTPQRGDIIVFIFPVDGRDFIKRVIGLPGEQIEIIGKNIIINGKPIEDPFGNYSAKGTLIQNWQSAHRFGPVVIPEGHYFVMGDNRDHSHDSRFWGSMQSENWDYPAGRHVDPIRKRIWGTVPSELIEGKAFIIYWSWPNWDRFLHLVK
jgi:signal peptidase I